MLDTMTAAQFSEVLNTRFNVQLSSPEALELELVEVKDYGQTGRQERFSLFFRGPLDPALLQGIFRLDHESLGTMDIFLVPVSREEDGMRYEAVFNRLKQPQTTPSK